MRKFLAVSVILLSTTAFSFAQPEPPASQNAPIPGIAYMAAAAVAYGVGRKKVLDRQKK